MRVYDFDKTIYAGDSTWHFIKFIIKKQPSLLYYLPSQAWASFLFFSGKIEKTQYKERLFKLFYRVKNIEEVVNEFWSIHKKGIKFFYLVERQSTDVIISASPYFLLKPICKELGIVHLIASQVDQNNGQFRSKNCFGEEKVRRFLEEGHCLSDMTHFYSDSYSDAPMARYANKAFMVKDNRILAWQLADRKEDL